MSSKKHKAQWWQVYVMLPVLLGLFVWEIRLGLKGTINIAAQLGILFLMFAFMQLWIRANRRALMHLDEESGEWQFKVYELSAEDLARARQAASRIERRPLVRLPESEVKGVLSTTFEMDEFGHDSAFPVGSERLPSEHVLNVKETKDIDA
jgi:hypothetical protein